MRFITVTSPATDAGKTFIGAGLAEAATARNLKTLFIDFDNPVGDSLRVFGVTPAKEYPTIASWREFSEPWNMTLMTDAGTHLLPKPDMLHEQISVENVQALLKQAQEFDLVIADLGTNYREEYWNYLVTNSDLAILVADRDEKAVVRIKTFLSTIAMDEDWLLVINSREKEGYYASSQIARLLSNDITRILELPYYPDAEKRIPKTYPPDSPYLAEILSMVFDIKKPVLPSSNKIITLPKIRFPAFDLSFPSRIKTTKSEKQPKTRKTSRLAKEKHRIEQPIQREFGNRQLNILANQHDILKSPKKSILIDLGGIITMRLQESYSDVWKSDWRLGLRAEPIKLPTGSLFYGQSRELGESIDRDEGLLIDFILHLSENKKPLYIIDPGNYTEMINRAGIM